MMSVQVSVRLFIDTEELMESFMELVSDVITEPILTEGGVPAAATLNEET